MSQTYTGPATGWLDIVDLVTGQERWLGTVPRCPDGVSCHRLRPARQLPRQRGLGKFAKAQATYAADEMGLG